MQKRTPMVYAQLLLLVSLSFSAVPCFAGTQQGFITAIYVRASDGLIVFHVSGTPQNKPGCAQLNYWIIRDENSTAGKQQLAQLLTAHALGSTVTVYGANTCTRWPDGEDVETIELR
jgi:hypothetical protein